MGDLSSPGQISHGTAQRAPGALSLWVSLRGAVNGELKSSVDSGFHPQHAALFVVKLDRVAVETVLDADPFGPVFEIAHDLSLELFGDLAGTRGNRAAQ